MQIKAICFGSIFWNFQFEPHLVVVAFCFSLNSDVSMMFRRHGIFSKMIITHDIRCITRRPDATLSQQQRELISQIGKNIIFYHLEVWKRFISVSRPEEVCVFLAGSAGTGKTLMLSEALKIKVSRLRNRGTDVKIFVTTFDDLNTELL